jgi:hypothetical protein
MPLPVRAARAEIDLPEVEEVLPASGRKAKPRREEEHDEPAARSGSGAGWIVVALILGVGVAGAGAMLLFGVSHRPVGAPVTSIVSKTNTGEATKPAFAPIREAEFQLVLEGLQPLLAAKGKVAITPQQKELVGRLSVTDPTLTQKAKRQATKKAKAGLDSLVEAGGAKKRLAELALAQAREQDEIWRVSCSLLPLMKYGDLESQKLAAMACQKWGTAEDVPDLIGLLNAGGYGADTVRLNAAMALAHIGDERGIAPVAERLKDGWDRSRGIVEALVAFGPKAEKYVWPYLSDPHAKKYAIEVLQQIGTAKSIPELRKLTTGTFPSKEAETAIKVIEARGARGYK